MQYTNKMTCFIHVLYYTNMKTNVEDVPHYQNVIAIDLVYAAMATARPLTAENSEWIRSAISLF